MRYLLLLAVFCFSCSAATRQDTDELCNGIDDDGDGCVDVLYDPGELLEGPGAWGAMLLQECSDSESWSVCINGEWAECRGDIFTAERRVSCERGVTQ